MNQGIYSTTLLCTIYKTCYTSDSDYCALFSFSMLWSSNCTGVFVASLYANMTVVI